MVDQVSASFFLFYNYLLLRLLQLTLFHAFLTSSAEMECFRRVKNDPASFDQRRHSLFRNQQPIV
jgi:hypothetical protein